MIPEDMSGGVDMPRPRRASRSSGAGRCFGEQPRKRWLLKEKELETLWRCRRFLGGSPIGESLS